ncbi:hypothetical protein C7974DRAFT_397264 [Boeremia exigua]|uniref:uncharacterized protein n=1 Tax=Boeremia exigua TaxID=749465 RepID=UPI001E8DFF21|nr:uncharacterized protein C7974DRAFT_397264 [Boeremia exigua]KAH6621864.1 hypothetical protein C7974DRAFT_397264 [Boeremia exigua]
MLPLRAMLVVVACQATAMVSGSNDNRVPQNYSRSRQHHVRCEPSLPRNATTSLQEAHAIMSTTAHPTLKKDT